MAPWLFLFFVFCLFKTIMCILACTNLCGVLPTFQDCFIYYSYIAMLQSFHLFHYLILDSLMIFFLLSDSPFTWVRFSSLVCIVNFWSEIHIQLPSSKKLSHYHQLCWRLLLVLPTSLIVSSSSYHAVFGLISVVYPHLWTLVNLLEGRDVFYWSSYSNPNAGWCFLDIV